IIKSIEITKPIGRVQRDDKGICAAGLLIPLAAAPTTAPTTAEASPATQEIVVETTLPAPTSAVAVRPKNEIRLDRLTVSGVDFHIEDTTSTPPTRIVLNGLDVDVRDVSNQMPYNGKPMRFSVLVTSDKVPLPIRRSKFTAHESSESATATENR